MSFSYKHRCVFYFREKVRRMRAYNAPRVLNRPDLGAFARPIVANEVKDLRDRENLELIESMRNPREKDFYQDHTYHDQWEQRELDKKNAKMLKQKYGYFLPGFQYDPWIWYPGDIVEVVKGDQAGQRGTILAVVPYKNEIIVQNINVKDITVPASDTRPEQVVQREHPIDAKMVKHVDPTTNELCDLQIITVRKKADASNAGDASHPAQTERKRISLQSGAILAIPPKKEGNTVETGDPLRDTPYQDAMESTYNPEEEMAILVERKLAAIEKGFLKQLKESYQFHSRLQEATAISMQEFQRDAHTLALEHLTEDMNRNAQNLDDWWFEELAPHIDELDRAAQQRLQRKADEQLKQQEAADAAHLAAMRTAEGEGELEDEEYEEEEEPANKEKPDEKP